MAKASKYYVVWTGRIPGIYTSWDEAKSQIDGFPEARYKSYESKPEAENAFKEGFKKNLYSNKTISTSGKQSRSNINQNSIAVDAACSGNPGDMEYRGVETATGKQIFLLGPFKEGTNNIGEFLGIVHGLALLKKLGREDMVIYSDSMTAISWVKKKKANTKLELTKNNAELFDLIGRAEAWLSKNSYKTQILKWDTKSWGEIPADFGRK